MGVSPGICIISFRRSHSQDSLKLSSFVNSASPYIPWDVPLFCPSFPHLPRRRHPPSLQLMLLATAGQNASPDHSVRIPSLVSFASYFTSLVAHRNTRPDPAQLFPSLPSIVSVVQRSLRTDPTTGFYASFRDIRCLFRCRIREAGPSRHVGRPQKASRTEPKVDPVSRISEGTSNAAYAGP